MDRHQLTDGSESDPRGGSPADAAPGAPDASPSVTPRSSSLRRAVQLAVLVLVVAAATWTVFQNRQSFVETVRSVGWGGVLLALVAGLLGVGVSGLEWRAVLGGFGVRLGVADALGVFFVSQLGKYLPGSVWPVVMQMEAGRQRGASRKTVLTANLVAIALSLATGLVIAGALLPFSSPDALRRFWWALAALPVVVVLALPRSLPSLMNLGFRLLRRSPIEVDMAPRASLVAAGWAALSWLGQGLLLAVLVCTVVGFSWGAVALSVGGTALAITAGILFIPAPAGAGLREVVLGFVLVTVMTSGQAVAVVVAMRVLLLLVDILLAGIAALTIRLRPSTA